MLYRITFGLICIGILFLLGCRTGEYNVDLKIYEEMPGILAADPELTDMLGKNEDGSVQVEFEKGEMFLWFAYCLDESTRQNVAGRALDHFHTQYLEHPDNRRKDQTFYREKILLRGFIDDVELYVIEWDLDMDHPNVVSNRHGNFM